MVSKEENRTYSSKDINLSTKMESGGLLSENIMHFSRVLRRAGLPIGPCQILVALRAVVQIGLSDRNDFYWALHAVFVTRLAQREVFDQVFHIFWRNPNILDRMMQLTLPDMLGSENSSAEPEDVLTRVAEAMASDQGDQTNIKEEKEIERVNKTDSWFNEGIALNKQERQILFLNLVL